MTTAKNGRYEYNFKRNILIKKSLILKIRKKIRFSMLVERKVESRKWKVESRK
jgi:hypothetical protein